MALGMLYVCSNAVKARLLPVLKKLNLPTKADVDTNIILEAISHDKKKSGDKVTVVFVEKVGDFEMKELTLNELEELLKGGEV